MSTWIRVEVKRKSEDRLYDEYFNVDNLLRVNIALVESGRYQVWGTTSTDHIFSISEFPTREAARQFAASMLGMNEPAAGSPDNERIAMLFPDAR